MLNHALIVCLFVFGFSLPGIAQVNCEQTSTLLKILKEQHYAPLDYTDSISSDIFELTISSVDPRGFYFLKSDLDKFETYRYVLEDNDFENACDFTEFIVKVFHERTTTISQEVSEFLKTPVNLFSGKKVDDIDPDDSFRNDMNELLEKWRLRLELMVVEDVSVKIDPSEIKDETVLQNVEKRARESLNLRYQTKFALISETEAVQRIVVSSFFNAICSRHDPHSMYFPPEDMKRFMEGVSTTRLAYGFSIAENDKREVFIDQIVPGSPAWVSNKVNVDDILIEASYPGKEPVLLNDLGIEEFNLILSGNKTDTLNLTLKKKSGKLTEVQLVKAEIEQEANQIEGLILDGESKVGYIYMPAFFTNWADFNLKGCANEVAKELVKLKRDGIEGLILDLRDNGGGSLKEAIELAGVFINIGPMAIQKDNEGNLVLMKDWNRGAAYNGPMVVLINNGSASASEVFTASLQDYSRAVVVGTPSFGKSSGQGIFPLKDDYLNYYDSNIEQTNSLGYVKVTKNMYYRLNKQTAQFSGVIPDIVLPDYNVASNDYERHYSYVLPGDSVEKDIRFSPLKALPIDHLKTSSKKRIASSSIFSDIESIENTWSNIVHSNYVHLDSLNQWNTQKNELIEKTNQAYLITNNSFNAKINSYDIDVLKSDSYRKSASDSFIKGLNSDAFLEETYHIMKDLIHFKSKQ